MKNIKKDHEYYMSQAILQAKRAFDRGEVPIGAVVVDKEGVIVGRGYNMVHNSRSQTEHAEIRAVKKACKKIGDWRLDGYKIYVTLEPCTMCFGLIKLCRISELIYGAESPLFGYRLDKDIDLDVYKKDTMKITKGVGEQESVDILKRFFKKRRKKGECKKEKCF